MCNLLLLAQLRVNHNDIGIPVVAADANTWANIIGAIFVFVGAWALLFVVIGAVRYTASNGDQGLIQRAKDTILFAMIGLVVSMIAFVIVQFVIGRV